MRDFPARLCFRAIPAVPHHPLEQQHWLGPAQGHTEIAGKLLEPKCQPLSHTDLVFREQCTHCSALEPGQHQSKARGAWGVTRDAKSCGGFGSCLIPSSSWTRNSIPCPVCAHSFPLSGAPCL